MAELTGAQIIARSLKDQGVEYMFGVIGVPVVPIAIEAQRAGIKFYGMRNEQAASYAAASVGYMTGRPGCCIGVSGPGMVHAIAGLANAWSNCWPMILLGGANNSYQNGMGAFQEAPQVEAARPWTKYAARPDSIERLSYYVEQAVRTSIYGRPGAVYLDLADDIISGKVDADSVTFAERCPDPPRPGADPAAIETALEALKGAERPLVIVGKGAAYAQAEDEVREFIDSTQLPFLATPMGKGVVPDDHPLSVAAGRSLALQQADVAVLLGARLNWILHFGHPPRWNKDVKIIQVDISGEEIGTNVSNTVPLVGDAKAVVGQINAALKQDPWQYPPETQWWNALSEKIENNRQQTAPMLASTATPMGYYPVLSTIDRIAPDDAVIVSEGASTMDIGRTLLLNRHARHRLDAGTFGTMGVGLGQAIAAAAVHPDKKIVCVEGDSAFGFSGMEVETACRYGLNICFIIVNNNGVGGGPAELDNSDIFSMPAGAYTPSAHYEKIIEGFGGKGYFVDKYEDLESTVAEAMASDKPTLVNIMIDVRSQRKPQEFAWLTR